MQMHFCLHMWLWKSKQVSVMSTNFSMRSQLGYTFKICETIHIHSFNSKTGSLGRIISKSFCDSVDEI
uniref:Uncharacterized protein n=1 Tax=Lotus japonicus TaxID=34305 RepID=I3T865_LOTJA|nr:unknown [Lotus japonicus]